MNMSKGRVYGVGVGPGDPELMTVKALRILREVDVIAVPGRKPEESAAYRIAVQMVPEITGKEIVAVSMPMVKDREVLRAGHRAAAEKIKKYLSEGRDTAFITLGDPSIYSTFTYLEPYLRADGYDTEIISGVPSFCAAAARLHVPLAQWDEPLYILPAVHQAGQPLPGNGTSVFMKAAGSMHDLKDMLKKEHRIAAAVENCGLSGEKVYGCVDEIPDDAGYFTLVIAPPEERSIS
jgi:precorrin-2/cobalt-factor-2 C20-methyltransferase